MKDLQRLEKYLCQSVVFETCVSNLIWRSGKLAENYLSSIIFQVQTLTDRFKGYDLNDRFLDKKLITQIVTDDVLSNYTWRKESYGISKKPTLAFCELHQINRLYFRLRRHMDSCFTLSQQEHFFTVYLKSNTRRLKYSFTSKKIFIPDLVLTIIIDIYVYANYLQIFAN